MGLSQEYNRKKVKKLVMLTAMYGCKSMDPDDLIRDESLFAGLQGSWRQQGYGNILEMGEHTYTLYQLSEVSCIQDSGDSLQNLGKALQSLEINEGKNQLVLQCKDNLTSYYFDRETALPVLCQKEGTAYTRDPEKNFEVLWHTLDFK